MTDHLLIEKFKGWLPILSCLLGLLAPASLPAAEADRGIGKVIALRGSAEIAAADGSIRSLALASALEIGEKITTGPRGRIQILFNDNTIISLGPRSELVIEEYQWDGGNTPGRMKSVISEGVFRVLGGSITRSAPENFTTETPSATIGIRGSMYAGSVRDGALQVVFQGGKGIFVRNQLRTVEISTPGFGTRVPAKDMPPVEPYRMPASELEKLDPLLATAPAADNRHDAAPDAEPTADTTEDENAGPQTADTMQSTGTETLQPRAEDPVSVPTSEGRPSSDILLADSGSASLAPRLPLPDLRAVTDTTTQASIDTGTSILQEQLSDSTSTLATPTLSGKFMAVQDDLDLFSAANDLVWLGSLSGTTADGVLTSQALTDRGTLVIDPLPVNPFNSTLAYSGVTKRLNQTRRVDLTGLSTIFNSAVVSSDNSGQFNILTLDDLFNNPSYSYREIGFAGVPTATLPTGSVDWYTGPLLLTLKDLNTPEFEGFSYDLKMIVNWHGGKVLGLVEGPGASPGGATEVSGFFLGDVSGTGLANVRFIGMDIVAFDPGLDIGTGSYFPLTIGGTTSFSQFYGRQAQGVGLVAQGNTYDLMSQTPMEDWQFTAAGYLASGLTTTSSTGTSIWQGFAVGIGDDMTAPDVNRRIFMNSAPSDFSLSLDRDTGSVSGQLNASDQAGAAIALRGLQIGGTNGSAYVRDDLIAAVVGGGTPVVSGTASGGLKSQGNYLLSENPDNPLARYASWGNWEIVYDDPVSTQTYHVHSPGTYWVAGERSPLAEVQNLISTNFSATYRGRAAGVMIPASGTFNNLSNGTSNLLIDFSAGAARPVSGTLDFTEVSLPVFSSSGSLDSSGFSGSISQATRSSLQGAFYGPNAGSIGGSFDAVMSTGERYTGIFGGDR